MRNENSTEIQYHIQSHLYLKHSSLHTPHSTLLTPHSSKKFACSHANFIFYFVLRPIYIIFAT